MDTYDIFRVASAPLDIVWADRDANLAAVDAIVDKVEDGADLLVLPELFSTGYVNDPQLLADIAETNTGRTVDRLKEWASRRSIAIAGNGRHAAVLPLPAAFWHALPTAIIIVLFLSNRREKKRTTTNAIFSLSAMRQRSTHRA